MNKFKLISTLVLMIFMSLTQIISANTTVDPDPLSMIKVAYRQYADLNLPDISTPTVFEVFIDQSGLERADFLVIDKETSLAVGSFLLPSKEKVSPLSVTTNQISSNINLLVDQNMETYSEFGISGDDLNSVQLIVKSSDGRPITSDSLYLILDRFVALPGTVSIRISPEMKIVLATTKVQSPIINFPKTTALEWTIDLTYSQPLRITELRLDNKNYIEDNAYRLRFLAQPDHDYRMYFDADRTVTVSKQETGNLSDNEGVVKLGDLITFKNPNYKMADTDGDDVPDVNDNCVSVANTDQADLNSNGRGDVCDDFDKDGLVNSLDNCVNIPNRNQQDTDGDNIGDLCDDEESRFTEKYSYLPWVGMITATLVVLVLFVLTALSMRKKKDSEIN